MPPQNDPLNDVKIYPKSEPAPKKQRNGMSAGAALILGLSAIIVAAIVMGGLIILRGVNLAEQFKDVSGLDINVNEEMQEDGSTNTQINVTRQNEGGTASQSNSSTPQSQSQIAFWQNVPISSVESILQTAGVYYMPEFGITLSETRDLNGDGVPEALYAGSGGNNSILFVFINTADGPELAMQKNQDGSIVPVTLTSVGRVAVRVMYEFLAGMNGYLVASSTLDQSNTSSEIWVCESFGVYLWNATTGMFEYDASLTQQYRAQKCTAA